MQPQVDQRVVSLQLTLVALDYRLSERSESPSTGKPRMWPGQHARHQTEFLHFGGIVCCSVTCYLTQLVWQQEASTSCLSLPQQPAGRDRAIVEDFRHTQYLMAQSGSIDVAPYNKLSS